MPLYESGESVISGKENVVKLSANENMNGPCNEVLNQFAYYSKNIFEYPDSNHFALRRKIGEIHDVDPNRIICGAGSDEIIQLLCRCFCEKNDEVIYTEHGFLMYKLSALAAGAKPIEVKERNRTASVENICAAITAKTKMIFLANPNNPTGTMISETEVEELLNKIPDNILLVLDGAYSEYVEENDYSIGFDLAKESENIVITKTFSKAFGLAGLRVGWAYCPKKIAERLDILKVPFSVNTAAQMAAISALKDDDHINFSVEHNSKWKKILKDSFTDIGLIVYPSQCNFLLVEFVDSFKVSAKKAYQILCSKGIIVREMEEYNLPNCLRISIGEEEANLLLLDTVNALK